MTPVTMLSGTHAVMKSASCSNVTVRAAPLTGCFAKNGIRF